MGFASSYRTLFEVRLLHHFFLNRADLLYDNMDSNNKSRALNGYDVRDFVAIEPTSACAQELGNYHLVYKNTSSGLIVGTRATQNPVKWFPSLPFQNDLRFAFRLRFDDL